MVVSFLFILTMLNRYVCKYTIYMYSIVYKKKKEESKEERRNNRLSDYSILGFLGSGNRVILSHIAEWGLFHSCSFIVMIEVFTPSTEKQLNRYNNTSGNIDKRVMSPVITVLEEVAKISAKEYNAMTPKQRESAFKKAVVIAIKNDIKFQSQLPKRD
jgi:hypothetical protein